MSETWTTEEYKLTVVIGGEQKEITAPTAGEAVKTLKELAKQAGLAKFQVLDEEGMPLSPQALKERLEEEGSLRVELVKLDTAG